MALTANQIAEKNKLAMYSAWIYLIQFDITGIKTLDYDGQTVNFTEGATLTGATSGATAKIISDSDSGATGTLTLWDVRGAFVNNETITDDEGADADADGTLSDNDLTYRISLNNEDISYDGETWSKGAIKLDMVKKSVSGKTEKLTIGIATKQVDALNLYHDLCDGLDGSLITLKAVNDDLLAEAEIIEEEFVVEEGGRSPDGMWLTYILGPYEKESTMFPARKYQRTPCDYQFKDANTCQYAGADTTCDRDLDDCVSKSNEDSYGAFPAVPGGFF